MECELRDYHQLFAERFVVRDRRPGAGRRSAEEGAELWLDEGAVAIHQSEVAKTLGHPAGGLALVTDFLPRAYPGLNWPGEAADAWSGPAAVFLVYLSPLGTTVLDRRLYLPEPWFGAGRPALDVENGVPAWAAFKSGPALGAEMVLAALSAGRVPAKAVALDQAYCHEHPLLDELHRKAHTYIVEISRGQRVWHRPAAARSAWQSEAADLMAARLPLSAWSACGPEEQIAALRVALDRHQRPGPDSWLIVRRPAGTAAVDRWRFFQSNAGPAAPLQELAALTDWQAPIQGVLEACRTDLAEAAPGWAGWHHHTTLTMLAHHFLVRLHTKYGAAAPALDVPQTRRLLQAILPQPEFDFAPVVIEIDRIQHCNLAAYFQFSDPVEAVDAFVPDWCV